MIRLRALAPGDARALVPVLAEAFGHYRDALRYTDEVLALFGQAWWPEGLGVVAEHRGEPIGAILAGTRTAVVEGRQVRLLHAGPVAVLPRFWHQGVGSGMMRALETQGDADVLTLTVNLIEDVGGFYQRLGFHVVETYQPWVHDLACSERAAPEGGGPALTELAPPLGDRPAPRVRTFQAGEARLQSVIWPVTTKRGGLRHELSTCQIVHREGHGPGLDRACQDLVLAAHADGARLVWGRPHLVAGLVGFRMSLAPGVARMGKGLTQGGREALARVRAWRPAGPSP